MAKEQSPPDTAPERPASAPSGVNLKKMLVIGLPLFVVQLGVVYFLLATFFASPSAPASSGAGDAAGHPEARETRWEVPPQKIFLVKDLIINPAGTNGTRFLLTTIGIEVSSGAGLQELEAKDVQVRDVLNSILTAKQLNDLVDVGRREDLRAEIARKVGEMLRSGNLTNVYFSKFIIQ